MTNKESLDQQLSSMYKKPLKEIPKKLRIIIQENCYLQHWDNHSPEKRKKLAQFYDRDHDPAWQAINLRLDDLFERESMAQMQINRWESVSTPTANELDLQTRQLDKHKAELTGIQKEIEEFSLNNTNEERNLHNLRKEKIHGSKLESLLKLILGMAMSKYGYEPNSGRSEATGEGRNSIHSDLNIHNIKIDNGTIKNLLREAETTIIFK